MLTHQQNCDTISIVEVSTSEKRAKTGKLGIIYVHTEGGFLPCVSDGANAQARENMLNAAYKAGAAFSKSYVGYIHAMAHALGGRYGTPHGLANAVIMPYVLESYGKSAHRKLQELGNAAGVCCPDDSHQAGAEKLIQAIRDLNRAMDIPDKLTGIRREDIPDLTRHAEREANPLYPVPKLMTAEELGELYDQIVDWSVAA